MAQSKVAVLVGSLREDSLNRKVAGVLGALAPQSLRLEDVPIGELALYNQELEANPPASWVELKGSIAAADAVLFVTPEYNRSIPAVLKNAIDIASRPYGQSAWDGKPGAVVSVSPSAMGGFGANHQLRQALVYLNVPVMQQPEAYIGNADTLFDGQGELKSSGTREFLGGFMEHFARWIETVRKQ